MVHRRYGKLPWADLFQPTIKLAREGFPIPPVQGLFISFIDQKQTPPLWYEIHYETQGALKYERHRLTHLTLLRKAFTDEKGNLLKTGDIIKFEKLADTLETIANVGAEAFYSGRIAEDLVRDVQEAGIVRTLSSMSAWLSDSIINEQINLICMHHSNLSDSS